MINQSTRSFYSIVFFLCLYTSRITPLAQAKSHDSVLASNAQQRLTLTTPIEELADDAAQDIYDDAEEIEDSGSTNNAVPSKPSVNKASANAQQIGGTDADYDGEGVETEAEQYPNDEANEDDNNPIHDSNSFPGSIPNVQRPDLQDNLNGNNGRPSAELSSTSRLPFVPATFWRELFAKPGILVGIIGGVVIGMLSAILLVMFIIYRMRKKDEGSYALEEGPRKSPSHAYTRVSSREFFA